jgi:chloramphenicol O-acetyltransferase type A
MAENADYLDLERWPRRAAYEHFRGFEQPFFSVTTRVDVAPLATWLSANHPGTLALAYHFLALRLANELAPFRYRLEGEGQTQRVRVHGVVHGSATAMRDDGSFGFVDLPWEPSFARFSAAGQAAFAAARQPGAAFDPRPEAAAVVYFTTLPWVHFSSFSHARSMPARDSIPRFAFGRIDAEPGNARRWMPLAVDAHHALLDGAHVGEFIQRLEAALAAPAGWLQGA